jgi:hypothetical protein
MIYIPIGSTSAAIHVLARILAKLFFWRTQVHLRPAMLS